MADLNLPEKMKCDVLIIGAGPAGSSLACFLSDYGIETILIDKKKYPDIPVRCAELVSGNLFTLFKEKTNGINFKISRMQTYINGVLKNEIPSPSVMLDREIFIDSVIKKFIKNNGTFLNSAYFESIISICKNKKETDFTDFSRDHFKKVTRKNFSFGSGGAVTYENFADNVNAVIFKKDSRKTFIINAKIIVCADGPEGISRKKINMPSDAEDNSGYILAYQETLRKTDKYYDKAMIFFYPYITNGYGWIFPKSDTFNAGIGIGISKSNSDKENLLARYNIFKKDIRTAGFLNGDEKVVKKITGTAPCTGIRYPISVSNFIFAGDAAGLCNPVTGAGIYNAVWSSKIISDSISDFLKTGDYNILNGIDLKIGSYFSSSIERALKKREYAGIHWPGEDFEELIRQTWISFKDYWKK